LADEQLEGTRESSDELLGQLAHEFSVLVRRDLQLTVAQHGRQLRHLAIEIAVALAAGAALLLTFAALSWAAVQGLEHAVPSWTASLIVAAAWALVAVVLLRLDHSRRLLRRLTEETRGRAIASAERDRRHAEEAVKVTAERLGEAVAREAAGRELKAGVSAAERLAAATEDEAEVALKELIVALLAPGKAGLSLLERMVGRQDREAPP
jgi:Putative Actinobacterial Holin-X, holin superfamily III